MNKYIGIDLGTSGLKAMLVSKDLEIIKSAYESYPLMQPQPLFSEQNPEDWYQAFLRALHTLLDGCEKDSVKGISFSGQMHGLVCLGENDEVLRPCILWNDGRSNKEVAYLNEKIGTEVISSYTGNIAFAGFTAPKILWMKNNETSLYKKIKKIMLPKDYLVYRITGNFVSDFSDASGTLLLDVKNKKWSKEMLELCGVSETQLPKLYESYENVGSILPNLCEEFEIPSLPVTIGAADNACAAIGTNTVSTGNCNISLGTSGTILIPSKTFVVDSKNALHSFVSASGEYYLMGCILSAANCRSWWLEKILNTEDYFGNEEEMMDVSTNDLYFIPYLNGERSPHNDADIQGAFIGLTSSTTKAQMSRAVLEGVAFALRDCLEIARQKGITPSVSSICGGGSRCNLWNQIISTVFNIPLVTMRQEQGPALGAAILAMVGAKEYDTILDVTKKLEIKTMIYPMKNKIEYYEEKYKKFRRIYPALKTI